MTQMTAESFGPYIEHNRLALVGLLAAVCSMLEFSLDAAPKFISKQLKAKILMVLRPAESAARRLIYVLRILSPEICVAFPARSAVVKSSLMVGGALPVNRIPPFKLFDATKYFGTGTRRKFAKHPPRILRPLDPDFVFVPVPVRKTRDVDNPPAQHIVNRLAALQNALADLRAQAKRMARQIVRREHMAAQNKLNKFTPTGPLRVGYPPGYRKRHLHPVDQVLSTCHWLACEARAGPS